jgi:hypothetical protein
MRALHELVLTFAVLAAASVQGAPLKVEARNASTPTQCAETDNVYVKFIAPLVRSFRIEAAHPGYLGTLAADNKAPDFAKCEKQVSPAKDYKFRPRQVTLYRDAKWELRGITYANFWRPNQVPVTADGRTETSLHLLQLWTRDQARNEEVLVLYPADGDWRARPLAPEKLPWEFDPLLPTAYGSSFLLGPVEPHKRPYVDIESVTFDPIGAFRVSFVRGGEALVTLAELGRERISLEISFERHAGKLPFAALRSMFVAPGNADVAEIAADGGPRMPVMKFRRAAVSEFWAGRTQPSRHNVSAPDMVFKSFAE